jgi:CRP-like cAMP-binding protein
MNRPGHPDSHSAKTQLFTGLSTRQLHTVSRLGTRIERKAGTVLTREGRPGAEFFIIVEGTVEVRAGNRVLATRGPGDCVGEIALLAQRPRTATVITTTPVVIDVLSRSEFVTLLDEIPELSDRLHTAMAQCLAQPDTQAQPMTLAS